MPAKTIEEKADELRQLAYEVNAAVGTRSLTGEKVLYVNGTDLDEQFVDQLLGGATFSEVQYRRNLYLQSRRSLVRLPLDGIDLCNRAPRRHGS